MTIEEQRAACARFEGWHLEQGSFERANELGLIKIQSIIGKMFWCDPKGKAVISVDDYHPDFDFVDDYHPSLDDLVSREQAEALKKELRERGYTYSLWYYDHTATYECNIHSGRNKPADKIVGYASGAKSEGSALVAATANLQTEREKK